MHITSLSNGKRLYFHTSWFSHFTACTLTHAHTGHPVRSGRIQHTYVYTHIVEVRQGGCGWREGENDIIHKLPHKCCHLLGLCALSNLDENCTYSASLYHQLPQHTVQQATSVQSILDGRDNCTTQVYRLTYTHTHQHYTTHQHYSTHHQHYPTHQH